MRHRSALNATVVRMNDSPDPEGSPVRLDPDDVERIASELGFAPGSGGAALREFERACLVSSAPEGSGGTTPALTRAGEQFLELRGDVPHDALFFLPELIDDLHARAALLAAGTELVEVFRAALGDGSGVEHARGLVPPAFAEAVDERMTYNLFAAVVALPVRLAVGDPPGCLAEEILAVRLVEIARRALGAQYYAGALSERDAATAAAATRNLYEIFLHDDVLELFEMHEPADAALAGEDADSRLEAWFRPSGDTPATGHLEP